MNGMSDGWYESVENTEPLSQGDIVSSCPVLTWAREVSGETPDALSGMVRAESADVVIMTQACDLEHEKVSNVILCAHDSLTDHKRAWEQLLREQSQNPTSRAWRSYFTDIRDGFVWNLALLNSGTAGDLETEHRVVDFHEVYSVPRPFLEALLRARAGVRLRLRPPYREHLSQAFARFFMRVGLPVGVANPFG